MRPLHPFLCGLTVGLVFGFWHLVWVTLVGTNLARPVLDIVLRWHFLKIDIGLLPFNTSSAFLLVALTFGIGFFLGGVFALVWNWLTKPVSSKIDGSDG